MKRTYSASDTLNKAKYANGVDHREGDSPPQVRTNQSKPCQIDECAAEQRNEQTVAARGLEPQDAVAWCASGGSIFPDTHSNEQGGDTAEKSGGLPGPG